MRPLNLIEVTKAVSSGEPFNAAINEFLDSFYTSNDVQREGMLASEPPLMESSANNAYIAAVAEHLALEYNMVIPDWVSEPCRFLKEPWFPSGLESLKATCIKESPVAFRRRMIFVDKDPLYRPRKEVPYFYDTEISPNT